MKVVHGGGNSGKSVSIVACVCVFLTGCVFGFHHSRTSPPGALSAVLWLCGNTLRIRWAAAASRGGGEVVIDG